MNDIDMLAFDNEIKLENIDEIKIRTYWTSNDGANIDEWKSKLKKYWFNTKRINVEIINTKKPAMCHKSFIDQK